MGTSNGKPVHCDNGENVDAQSIDAIKVLKTNEPIDHAEDNTAIIDDHVPECDYETRAHQTDVSVPEDQSGSYKRDWHYYDNFEEEYTLGDVVEVSETAIEGAETVTAAAVRLWDAAYHELAEDLGEADL